MHHYIHHQLLKITNFSDRKVLVLITFLSVILALVGITGDLYNIPEWAMFIGFIALLLIYISGILSMKKISS